MNLDEARFTDGPLAGKFLEPNCYNLQNARDNNAYVFVFFFSSSTTTNVSSVTYTDSRRLPLEKASNAEILSLPTTSTNN